MVTSNRMPSRCESAAILEQAIRDETVSGAGGGGRWPRGLAEVAGGRDRRQEGGRARRWGLILWRVGYGDQQRDAGPMRVGSDPWAGVSRRDGVCDGGCAD